MPASYVQNHVQQFEGRVRRGPLNAGLRSSPSRIQDSIRELPDGNVSAGRRDAGGSGGMRCLVVSRANQKLTSQLPTNRPEAHNNTSALLLLVAKSFSEGGSRWRSISGSLAVLMKMVRQL